MRSSIDAPGGSGCRACGLRVAYQTDHPPEERVRGSDMAGRLQGKVAIVSGAGCVGPGWGNGRAMAVILAQEGPKVFAADKSLDAMTETLARVRESGGEIEAHQCDAIDSEQV